MTSHFRAVTPLASCERMVEMEDMGRTKVGYDGEKLGSKGQQGGGKGRGGRSKGGVPEQDS
jgi:hypothetical protein